MARKGKQSLADTVDESEIVEEEITSDTNIIIDDEYGIKGKYRDYALVVKKVAHRTGKAEDGENEGKVIRYEKWEDVLYCDSIFDCLRSYQDVTNLSKIKALKNCKDYLEIEKILKDTQATIRKALREWSMAKDNTECAMLMDEIAELRKQLNDSKDLIKEVNDFKAWMKSKRAELFKNVEPTKHRMKLEK